MHRPNRYSPRPHWLEPMCDCIYELPLDDIPDVAISDLSDWQLATYLCQRRLGAILSLQCTADSAVSIEWRHGLLARGDDTLHDVAGVCDCRYGLR